MLNPLSLVAGMITLTGGVIGVVKYARTFYRNSEELGELQEQLEQFANVLSGIDDQRSTHAANIITILGKAKITLEQLKGLFETRITSKMNNSSRSRRRSWARNKSKMCRIQSSLKEHRMNLVLALSANNSSSAAQSEATLISISREVGCSTDSSITLRTQLANIQETISKTHDAVAVQGATVNSALQSIAAGLNRQLCATDEPSSSQGALSSGESDHQCAKKSASNSYAMLGASLSPKPMTPLERSQNFYPESYTTDNLVPLSCLMVNNAWEQCEGVDFKINVYRLFYLDRDTIEWRPQVSPVDALSTSPRLLPASSALLNYLHDLGCKRYDESQVVQIEIIDPPCYFCSSLNGVLVFEIKFLDTTPTSEWIYAIRALHCMNGASGFSKLAGVVTDDSRRYLKSYLVELPRQCRNILTVADPSLSWERRERWAIQLIRGISLAHSQGFVFGGLTTKTRPVIDDTDSVRFWSFKERFLPGRTVGAYYPPEFHYVRNMSPLIKEDDIPCVTTKTDIFHLGMLLWLLAEKKPETHASPICRRMQCNASGKKDGICDASHAEPVTLPPLPESIPKYFRDIVDACRREDASERPAAREILEIFPRSYISQLGAPGPNKADIRMLVEGMTIHGITCDICTRRPLPLPLFHCNVCLFGDFDLCQMCYKSGTHCYDDSHLLVEMGKIGSWIVPQKYHSCVKASGTRDIIDL
ncbi:MAG: hypothetical protein LQ342_003691 [Letrouitia transgressa]|nr:MAG: hypothetical protein LQ342_003691 [Letrouitia transgressa]